MTKRLLFSAVLVAMMSTNGAQAFTMAFPNSPSHVVARAEADDATSEDVTSTYLKNAGFDTDADFQTSDVATGNIKSLTDWTAESTADKCAQSLGAPFAIGSTAKFNNASVPATNADGSTTGGVMAFSVGWSQQVLYSQDLNDLPAGVYHFEYAAYNANDKTVAQNLIGYVDGNGKTYYGTKTSFAKG